MIDSYVGRQMGFFEKLKAGLKKTKAALATPLKELFGSADKIDEAFYEELFDILVCADVGVSGANAICDSLRERVREEKLKTASEARGLLSGIIRDIIGENEPLKLTTRPSVILVIGVNGVGKTTSVGKIAQNLKNSGKSVLLCAADTFRAAAIDQLAVWGERAGVPVIAQKEGADPAAVVFDAINAAKTRGTEILIVDTAGRLLNKTNLINELAKINRIIRRELPDCDVETLLVLDAVTGQNAIAQAREFSKAADIDGIVLTKLDGTAKGGIVIAVRLELGIPVKLIGVGEGVEDMQPFDRDEFVRALLGERQEEEG